MNARSTQDTPLWNTMRRSDFDASEPLTLFDIERDATAPVKADKCGTPDMFAEVEEAQNLVECPRCHSRELPAYFERHMNRHAATDRNHDANVRASAAMNRQLGRTPRTPW